jgi:multidrug efflux pump subunit AcrA (membrane-fusion protein)
MNFEDGNMPEKYKRFIPVVVIILGALIYGIYVLLQNSVFNNELVVSGTIEAREVHLGVVTGGTVDRILVEEGDAVKKDQLLAVVKDVTGGASGNIRSPLNGIVLMRSAEPGEMTTAGGSILIVADLQTVTLTVYVPEDRYGKVYLGELYEVHVDSFPDNPFIGTVTYISDRAEFTPRNAQSVQNRKNTVYAVKLTISNPSLDLKPGMPADVKMNLK